MNSDNPHLPQQIRTMQIIAAALILGVVVFLGIAIYVVQNNEGGLGEQPGAAPIVTFVALAVFAVQTIAAQVVPRLVAEHQVRRIANGTWSLPQPGRPSNVELYTDAAKLAMVYQTTMILSFALLEGAAFLACIAYLLEGQLVAPVVVVLLLLFMITSFPVKDKVQNWIDQRLRRLDEMR